MRPLRHVRTERCCVDDAAILHHAPNATPWQLLIEDDFRDIEPIPEVDEVVPTEGLVSCSFMTRMELEHELPAQEGGDSASTAMLLTANEGRHECVIIARILQLDDEFGNPCPSFACAYMTQCMKLLQRLLGFS
jgi:hypothetical protein